MILAQTLRDAILQAAMQGKLTEQLDTDSSVDELLITIANEKEEYLRTHRIMKGKALSEVSESEVPFDIPETWRWVRWGTLSNSIQYGYNAPAISVGKIRMVRISDIQDNSVIWNSVPFCDINDDMIDSYLLNENDILFARTGGTVGKSYLVTDMTEKAIYAGYLIRSNYNKRLCPKYLKYFMEGPLYWVQLHNGTTKTAQPNCNGKTLAKMILPLPPIEEQQRIVGRVNELLAKVDEFEKIENRLTAVKEKFPSDLRAAILQAAMQGQLTEQLDTDSSVDAAITNLASEKKTIGVGKGGKQIAICEEEAPYELPSSWRWIRLSDVVYNRGQKTPTDTFSYIDIGSIDNVHQKLNKNETIIEAGSAPSRARKIVKQGDVLYATVRPYLHNMCIIDREFSYEPIASTGFAVMVCHSCLLNKYLLYYLLSPAFDSYANATDNAKGVAYPAINDKKLYAGLIPLPPIEEQQRIVERLEALLPLCDELTEE